MYISSTDNFFGIKKLIKALPDPLRKKVRRKALQQLEFCLRLNLIISIIVINDLFHYVEDIFGNCY